MTYTSNLKEGICLVPQIGSMRTALSVYGNSISASKIFYFMKIYENKSYHILYFNVDGLLNEKDELMSITECGKPLIIALSEIKPKRQYNFNIAEHNIPGYTLFVNNKIKRGVAIYAHVSLSAQLFNTLCNCAFEKSVSCQCNALNNTKVLLGCIYKSTNISEQNE